MLNYMRSEFYRIFHSCSFYVTLAIFAGLPIFVNGLLKLMADKDDGFPYAVTSFSYSNFVANPLWLAYAGIIVVYILFESDKQNGNLKNVVAIGIGRTKVFVGRCIIATVICTLILAGTLITYIGSAELLLQTAGPIVWQDMLKTVAVSFLIAVSSVVLGIALIMMFRSEWTGILLWFAIFEFIPMVISILSLQFSNLQGIARWMPTYIFDQMVVNMSTFEPIWQTVDGLEKCIGSGLAGIVIFGLIGMWRVRKMEV